MIRPVLAARRMIGGALAVGVGSAGVDLTNLKLWIDADSPATLFQDDAGTTPVTVDGDVVGRASDRSGIGNHMVQATPANKPLYKTGILNGKPVIRFDGLNDVLATVAPVSTVTNNFCMIVAMKPGATTAERAPFFNGLGSTNGYGPAQSTNTGKKGALRGGVAWDSSVENADTAANIYVFSRVSGSSKLYVAGVLLVTVATAPLAPTTTTTIGGHFSTRPCNVDVAELVFYEAGLSNASINTVCNYLASKWSLIWSNI